MCDNQNVKDFLLQYDRINATIYVYNAEIRQAKKDLKNETVTLPYWFRLELERIILHYQRRLSAAQDQRKEIEKVIASVPDPTERQVLIMRYINGCSWGIIAERLHYCVQNVHNIHNRALASLSKIIT